ncbi:MAG TPA: LuxR C-terminal-related transcriptional regulator [Solirubrobacteraceae bacterium]|jgi:DNA-binding CsgD family transcriptional regulator|nr:LuxR C-terminal-related transcriptional regulator [Solirubrobacteraceae bacterium]
MTLSANDVRRVLDFVGEAHGAGDLDELRRFLPIGLSELVRTDYASYNEVGSDGAVYATVIHPEIDDPQALADWARYAHQNPLMSHYARTRDGRAYRFSDVADQRELDRLELFSEFYRSLGVRHQIAFTLPSPPQLTFGLALSRGGRDYTDRDRDALNLTRPHLIQAYRNVQARERAADLIEALRRGVDAGGEAIAIVDAGLLSFVSQAARGFLLALGWRDGGETPRALLEPGPTGRAWDPLLIRSGERNTIVRRLPSGSRDSFVVVFERPRTELTEIALRSLGLSPRESEVLRLLARGQSTGSIAARMQISPRTVHKHTERIHAKLGTHDRAQAIATALAAEQEAGEPRRVPVG